uniref:ADP-ribosylglycohydrolase n=1 Tax=Strombidium rassoulzadegani TaxID=1082188 RepID=A0A7S3FTU6_9SPIT|mmetsp:Transcript_17736/g.30028  ORF Transcript_17736/g.30028 Transcript_17736/m.30028 type:complete len:147 (+) Transcript_17736:682-1122(+)
MEAIRVIRNVRAVEPFALLFSDMLVAVLNGKDLREVCQEAATRLGLGNLEQIVKSSRSDPMVACYIDSSFPALLFIVYKYASDTETAILANANAGGENVARGSLLGALVGAAHGIKQFPQWSHQLVGREEIMGEIEQLVGRAKEEL